MNFDDVVDTIGVLPLTVLSGLRVCPVCKGNGTMWLRETEGDAMPFGVEVQCWHCSGSGRMYMSTTTGVES